MLTDYFVLHHHKLQIEGLSDIYPQLDLLNNYLKDLADDPV